MFPYNYRHIIVRHIIGSKMRLRAPDACDSNAIQMVSMQFSCCSLLLCNQLGNQCAYISHITHFDDDAHSFICGITLFCLGCSLVFFFTLHFVFFFSLFPYNVANTNDVWTSNEPAIVIITQANISMEKRQHLQEFPSIPRNRLVGLNVFSLYSHL